MIFSAIGHNLAPISPNSLPGSPKLPTASRIAVIISMITPPNKASLSSPFDFGQLPTQPKTQYS
jgi:hypothetical protein